jgi:hypothetical protein
MEYDIQLDEETERNMEQEMLALTIRHIYAGDIPEGMTPEQVRTRLNESLHQFKQNWENYPEVRHIYMPQRRKRKRRR